MSQTPDSRFKSLLHNRTVPVILVAVFLVLGVAAALLSYNFIRGLVATWNMTTLPGVRITDDTTAQQTGSGTAVPQSEAPLSNGPSAQPWDGTSRVTMLVMGLDFRDWQAGDIPRTDSMWLFSIDPVSKTAGMMSIPRDTWVNIPGFGSAKINTAFFLGEANKLPGGGPALAVKTVEGFIGVPIDYYAQIDFQAFVDFIDKLDGIYVDIPQEIKVDPVGKGNTVTLEPGRQRLFGAVALGYARNRYTEGSDYDRSKRQLQIIMAIRDRVFAPSYIPTLIGAAPHLYQKLSGGIHTNMTLQDGLKLALLAAKISKESIHTTMIGPNEVHDATSPEGLSIEIPIPEKIRLLRDQVFATGGPVGPSLDSDQAGLAKLENAKITVQNGSGAYAGLAERTSDYLKSLGLNVTGIGNADAVTSATKIYDYSGKPYTVAYLVNTLHVGQNQVVSRYDPNAQVDVVVVAGQDWAIKNPMPQ